MNRIRIIIIEDHVLTRIGLKTAFEGKSDFEILGEAEYGEDGIKLVNELKPDMVIVDLGLPGMDGIQVIREIKSSTNTKVIVLTSHESEQKVLDAVIAGADAYCMKDINPERLIFIMREIFKSGVWYENNIIQIIRKNLVLNLKAPDVNISKSPLSDREIEVLQLLADLKGNQEIASELGVSQHTIKSHICNILQKLSVDDRTQAVSMGFRNKWIK